MASLTYFLLSFINERPMSFTQATIQYNYYGSDIEIFYKICILRVYIKSLNSEIWTRSTETELILTIKIRDGLGNR